MEYLTTLNEKQRQAVLHGDGPILILAGAGSGKTRVLTHRISHLIFERKVAPDQILALTFTNKAAAEMRGRVVKLLDRLMPNIFSERELWISTFHSACVRILRSDIHHIGYSNQFTIYDDSDQRSVIKACLKDLNISDSVYAPKAIQGRINKIKNEGYDSQSYQPSYGGPLEEVFCQVFERYEEVLKQSSALDFADLILKTVSLFEKTPNILKAYQQRFPYLLIDEYQDTNRCQYLLMKMLAGNAHNVCVVGDEDQSIYKWRGADIRNILNFEKDFPNSVIFKLEQNYRSTKNIIEAASSVISYNTERRDKTLWTSNDDGDQITLFECYDEHDEAHKLIHEVNEAISNGAALNEMAVFYRTNAQSRLVEDMLRAKSVNYQIYGGLKFYDRLEVKDTLAYLKLVSNPSDDVSFRRIVNVPARGIGAVSLDKFNTRAKEVGCSLYALLGKMFGPEPEIENDLGRSGNKFRQFYELVETFRASGNRVLPSDLINMVIEDTGYRRSLTDDPSPESQSRLENLAELRQSVVEFELRRGAENPEKQITLEGFLEEIALVSDLDKHDPHAPAVKLMTIHMAKGLEFEDVFILGLEEELFPNIRPWEPEDASDIEEERRLFYVAITRARKNLRLFYAKNRTVFGNAHFRVISRFVDEIPEKYLDKRKADYFSRRRQYVDRPGLVPGKNQAYRDDSFEDAPQDDYSQVAPNDDYTGPSLADKDAEFKRGSRVLHPAFGEGVVRQCLGGDKLMVEFPGQGLKKISLKFSLLKGVE